MIGLKLNQTTHDIERINNRISLLSTVQEAVRQKLDIKFKTWQGEWVLDTTFGMPYRQQIIGKARNQQEIDALYLAAINEEPEVIRINSFASTYNAVNRQYSLSFDVTVNDRELRVEDVYNTVNDEIYYGDGNNVVLKPSCSVDFLQYSLDIHPIIHDDLPENGQSTWWYFDSAYAVDGYVDVGYVRQRDV